MSKSKDVNLIPAWSTGYRHLNPLRWVLSPPSILCRSKDDSESPTTPSFVYWILFRKKQQCLYRYLMRWLYHHNHSNAYKQIVMHMTTACCNIFASIKHPNSLLTVCWVIMKGTKRVQCDFALQKTWLFNAHGHLRMSLSEEPLCQCWVLSLWSRIVLSIRKPHDQWSVVNIITLASVIPYIYHR